MRDGNDDGAHAPPQERRRDRWTIGLAIVSLGIAVGSLVVSVVSIVTPATA